MEEQPTKQYLLTIRIPFSAYDDPDARERIREMRLDPVKALTQDLKLQEIYRGKPPRGIRL